MKKKKVDGFTLTEVMVAMFLMAGILAAAGLAFTSSLQHFQLVRDKQSGTSQAVMALRMIEKELDRVSCINDGTCGSGANSVIMRDPDGKGLSGRVQLVDGSESFFRFEYRDTSGPPNLRRIIVYCTPANITTPNCVGSSNFLVIARNIYNDSAVPMFTLSNDTWVGVSILALEGMEGPAQRLRQFQSTYIIAYGH